MFKERNIHLANHMYVGIKPMWIFQDSWTSLRVPLDKDISESSCFREAFVALYIQKNCPLPSKNALRQEAQKSTMASAGWRSSSKLISQQGSETHVNCLPGMVCLPKLRGTTNNTSQISCRSTIRFACISHYIHHSPLEATKIHRESDPPKLNNLTDTPEVLLPNRLAQVVQTLPIFQQGTLLWTPRVRWQPIVDGFMEKCWGIHLQVLHEGGLT